MSLTMFRRLAVALTLTSLLGSTSAALADPVVRQASGANAAAIQPTVDQFRADLGGANNGATASTFTEGRREINWDGVSDANASPNSLAGDAFRARGAVFTTPGSGFQVSMDDDAPADADADAVRFSQFNAVYATEFVTFSSQRLFSPIGSTIIDVTFRVPGSNRPASVKGFGVVFTDVDALGSTTVQFFDERGAILNVSFADSAAPVGPGGVSFVGVSFDGGERVARVRITSGSAVLSTGTPDGPGWDAVAMDDFIYGEPQALTLPAALDSAFGIGGVSTIDFGVFETAEAMLVQPDGKVVLAGTWDPGGADFAVVRLNTDGSLDSTFSGDGRVTIAFDAGGSAERAHGIARQADGKLVVVGETTAGPASANNMAVARLTADGELDDTFAGDGTVVVDFGLNERSNAVAIQADGGIVVVGWVVEPLGSASDTDMAVIRLLADGTLDASFNASATPTPAHGNGRIRLTRAGLDQANDVAVQPDGAILVTGTSGEPNADAAVVRLLASGALDDTFADSGWATIDFGLAETAESVLPLPDGRIVVGGTRNLSEFIVARLLPSGALDTTFNADSTSSPSNFNGRQRVDFGATTERLFALALQPDGKVVLAGVVVPFGFGSQAAVVRLTQDGLLDTTFATLGRATYDLYNSNETLHAAAVRPNGSIVLGGSRGIDVFAMQLVGGPTPGVFITTPTTTLTLDAVTPFVTLKGVAGDDVAVTEIAWSSDRGFSGIAAGTSTWQFEVPVLGGANTITVTAKDAAGNTATDTIVVNVGAFTYYLSEGATGSFFDLDILVANPTETAADVQIAYLKPDGSTVPQSFTLAPRSRRTVKVETIPGLADTAVSAVVTSANGVPLAVERTMFWDDTYYGGHTGNAVEAPRTQWYFGEGNQGFFDTYVLLANANGSQATATVTFLVEGGPNVTQVLDLAPTSRLNVYAGTIPSLAGKSFSIVVTSTLPIIAERAMYFGRRLFEGGHESAGVGEPATTWFHAEGATGSYFDTYILVGNPNPAPANLTMTFLKGDGTSLVRNKTVPANGRFTLFVDGEDPALADTAVSTTVVSDLPVVSERAMYWGGTSATWFEAHNSFGVTRTGQKWALAEGRVGQGPKFETYVLLANPSSAVAQVRATFLRTSGEPVVKTYDVSPTSRFNVWVNAMVPELKDEDFGVVIEVLNGVDVAVERALYWTSGGVGFAGGTNATAVRVP